MHVAYRVIQCVLAIWVVSSWFFASYPICCASDHDDKEPTNSLIAILESGESGQAAQAESIFAKIPQNANRKPIAEYALALIQIRDAKYREAWDTLAVPKKSPDAVPDAIKLGTERLRLWLLLEVGATEKSELQFKRLAMMSVRADTAMTDQTACCSLIGAVIGMLNTKKENSCIPAKTLEKEKVTLLQKIQNRNAIAKLEDHLLEASKWGAELSDMVSRFESIGREKAIEQCKLSQSEFEKAKQEKQSLRSDLKSVNEEKQILEDQRRNWFKNKNGTLAEMKLETPGRPAFPVPPGPPPREPIGEYKTDARTQETKYVPPSQSGRREYDEKAKKWRKDSASYQRDVLEYPEKKRLWDIKDAERKAFLQNQLNTAEAGIRDKEKAIADLITNSKQGVGKELKEADDKLDLLERCAVISSLAMKHVASSDSKTKSLIRPSNFQILDYDSECILLRKAIR